jgi:hypothetical protein
MDQVPGEIAEFLRHTEEGAYFESVNFTTVTVLDLDAFARVVVVSFGYTLKVSLESIQYNKSVMLYPKNRQFYQIFHQ